MNLSVGEKIMVLRQREKLKIIQLAEVFKKTRRGMKNIANPHIKLKKIELGTLAPTDKELEALAERLHVDVRALTEDNYEKDKGLLVPEGLIDAFPKLKFYLETLISAFNLKDGDLIKTMTDRLGVTEPTDKQVKESSS